MAIASIVALLVHRRDDLASSFAALNRLCCRSRIGRVAKRNAGLLPDPESATTAIHRTAGTRPESLIRRRRVDPIAAAQTASAGNAT